MFGDGVLGIGTTLSGFTTVGSKDRPGFTTASETAVELCVQIQVGAQALNLVHILKCKLVHRLHLYININITGWIYIST